MDGFDLKIKFEGETAAHHMIPAYEGSIALRGFARSFTLIGHYLDTGKIKKHPPYSDNVNFYLNHSRAGSFEQVIDVFVQNQEALIVATVAGAASSLASDISKSFTKILKDMIVTIYKRCIGQDAEFETKQLQELEDKKPGDIDALVDSLEPAMKDAHRIIENGATEVSIVLNNYKLITLNNITKEYVSYSEESDIDEFMDVSVGSYNVNTGNGRVFLEDLGKTIPFKLHQNADVGSKVALSYSLDQYANNKPSYIEIRFRRILSKDERTKKLIILGAYKLDEAENTLRSQFPG